ncbi:uncharacterized protein LOC114769645 [Denticeps clupeoides]|uniref:uncharacterized protein LOC114769645 n=1 Tax=Denticeps clupeoides TaxID=299321 RepID=UPI0010A3D2E1|nr:uncharacterized protein LOC114769645 [Denticeps clupeoides]
MDADGGAPYVVVKLEEEEEEEPGSETDPLMFAPLDFSDDDDEEEEEEGEEAEEMQTTTWPSREFRDVEDPSNRRCSKDPPASGEDNMPSRAPSRMCSPKTFHHRLRTMIEKTRSAKRVDVAGRVPAPWTRSDPCPAISPQTAAEPPAFPTVRDVPGVPQEKPQVRERQDDVLQDVLHHCRLLSTVLQRVEQKIDGLQAKLFNLNRPPEEPRWYSAIRRLEEKIDDLRSRGGEILHRGTPRQTKRHFMSPLPAPQLPWGTSHLPGLKGRQSGAVGQERDPRWRPPWKGESSQPGAADYFSPDAVSARGSRGRGRGIGRGRPARTTRDSHQWEKPKRPLAPATGAGQRPLKMLKTTTVVLAPVPSANTLAATGPMKNDVPSSGEEQQNVLIGSPLRKVWVPLSAYLKAFKEDEPRKAIVPVLHAVFPTSVLATSGVTGDPARGVQELNPNKLEAIREWLAEMYPSYDVEVRGKTWAECLGVLNNIIKTLRYDKDRVPTSRRLPAHTQDQN